MSCQITARLARHGEVRVEDVGGELHAVIDRAADRLSRSVARELVRRREVRRRGGDWALPPAALADGVMGRLVSSSGLPGSRAGRRPRRRPVAAEKEALS